jgi:hypothetical protein
MHEQLMYHAIQYFNRSVIDESLPTLSDAVHCTSVLVALEESLRKGEGVEL